jgi:c-di-GMP-binding flagellar brake protein YcgR
MDEKIDKILRMLEKEKGIDTSDSYGQGIDISASGMRVVIDSPAKQGDIIKSNFLLSKNPLIFVDVYGEIVWVKKKEAPNGTLHQMGVRFLDLQLGIKEKIISCIFQKQREDIRRMRSESAGAQ